MTVNGAPGAVRSGSLVRQTKGQGAWVQGNALCLVRLPVDYA